MLNARVRFPLPAPWLAIFSSTATQSGALPAPQAGCKGLTTYRPNAVTGSVLSVEGKAKAEPETQLAPRAEALAGSTYKLKRPDSAHAVYVTINDVDTRGGRRPFEIFINSKNMEHYAWQLGVTPMISAVFRRGGDVSFVPDELKAVFDPRGGAWMGGKYVPSLLAAIGGVIERHMGLAQPSLRLPIPQAAPVTRPASRACCPQCGAAGLVKVEAATTAWSAATRNAASAVSWGRRACGDYGPVAPGVRQGCTRRAADCNAAQARR